MKTLILTAIILSSSAVLLAQDCAVYFPSKVGTVMEMTDYDAKGREESKGMTLLKEIKDEGAVKLFLAETSTITSEGDTLKVEYAARCENGVFSVNMFSGMANQGGGPMNIEGDFLDFPKNPVSGMTLDDKLMTISLTAGDQSEESALPAIKLKYQFINRKIESLEKIKTPAGEFETVKMSYDVSYRMGILLTYHVVEWYAKDVGLVRSELYNKKGKLKSYRELTKFE